MGKYHAQIGNGGSIMLRLEDQGVNIELDMVNGGYDQV